MGNYHSPTDLRIDNIPPEVEELPIIYTPYLGYGLEFDAEPASGNPVDISSLITISMEQTSGYPGYVPCDVTLSCTYPNDYSFDNTEWDFGDGSVLAVSNFLKNSIEHHYTSQDQMLATVYLSGPLCYGDAQKWIFFSELPADNGIEMRLHNINYDAGSGITRTIGDIRAIVDDGSMSYNRTSTSDINNETGTQTLSNSQGLTQDGPVNITLYIRFVVTTRNGSNITSTSILHNTVGITFSRLEPSTVNLNSSEFGQFEEGFANVLVTASPFSYSPDVYVLVAGKTPTYWTDPITSTHYGIENIKELETSVAGSYTYRSSFKVPIGSIHSNTIVRLEGAYRENFSTVDFYFGSYQPIIPIHTENVLVYFMQQ